jgi:hypothetical protein
MKDLIIKYVFIFLVVCVSIIPIMVFVSSISGCARVSYKKETQSTKCNFAIMMIKLKSIKGNEAFEVGKFVDECYHDLDVIRCTERVYNNKVDNDEKKRYKFLQCLKE